MVRERALFKRESRVSLVRERALFKRESRVSLAREGEKGEEREGSGLWQGRVSMVRERNGILERDKTQREGLRAFLGKRSILETTGSMVKKMVMAREEEHGGGGGRMANKERDHVD